MRIQYRTGLFMLLLGYWSNGLVGRDEF